MTEFAEKDYKMFEMFHKRWALVTAGSIEKHNACTVSWGSLGTLWTRPGKSGHIVAVYIHPARYTQEFLTENNTFTVSFFHESYRKVLSYLGSHSGRDGDKISVVGLTPVAMGDSVAYEEAELTFLCRKVYQHPFAKEEIAEDVQEYYKAYRRVYPLDENGEWQPHWMFIGEIIDVVDHRAQ
jgi:flavin reductase (DIM6/NTAB) family NADH-FMN oxidoreductase RutF